MKKVLLFAVILCYLMSASAQPIKNEPKAQKTWKTTIQQVEIFSMDGKQVMYLENNFETIHVDALAKGCYLLKATFADGSKAMRKFVKE